MIRGVSFDFWNTLAYPVEQEWETFRRVLASLGLEVGEGTAKGAIKAAARWRRDEGRAGRVWDERAFGNFCQIALSSLPDHKAMSAHYVTMGWTQTAKSKLFDDVPECLTSFKARGLKTMIVANSWGVQNIEAHLSRLGITGYFDCLVASGSLGTEKPDPRVFLYGSKTLGIPPHNLVHIGDTFETDIVGARAAGIEPVLLDRTGQPARPDCTVLRSLSEFEAWVGRNCGPGPSAHK